MTTDTADRKAAFKAAELAVKQAEAREAAAKADLAALRTAQALREETHHLVNDHYAREHHFIGAVDGKTVTDASNRLAAWHRLDPKSDMNIVMHSGGGSVLAGLSLFDQITAYSKRAGRGGEHHITMTIRGVAASMAGVLVQAADERVIGPESYLMIHELSASTGGKIGELRDAMKFYELMGDRIAKVYVNRSGGKTSLAEFKELWTDRDVWMDAEEALARGFVDRIG